MADDVHRALRMRAAETGETMEDILDRALRKELGLMETRRTLQDLTGRESGIIVYGDRVARVVNWSSTDGIPYDTALGPIDMPQDIPQVNGERCELADLLDGVELDRGSLPDDEDLPEGGTAYRISDDILVITPDGWI